MSAIYLRNLHPRVRVRAELALAWAKVYGLSVTVTSGSRTLSEQTALRQQYDDCLARGARIYPGNPDPRCRYPANKPGDSAHNFGLAFDSSVPGHQQWAWDYLRRAAGFHVPESDPIHAEVPSWRLYRGV